MESSSTLPHHCRAADRMEPWWKLPERCMALRRPLLRRAGSANVSRLRSAAPREKRKLRVLSDSTALWARDGRGGVSLCLSGGG